MRVDELVRSLLGRPVALVVVVAVALLGAAYGWTSASTTYESRAVVLVIPPAGTSGGPDANPLVNLDYSIAQLALSVSSQLQGDTVKEAVVAAGGSSAYTADTLSSDNSAVAQLSPQISLVASAATPGAAQQATTVLVEQASAQLTALQTTAKVPAASRASVVTSSEPTAGAAVGNAQLRAAGVLGVAGGLAALLVLVALQPRQLGRRSHGKVSDAAVKALLQDEWSRSGRNVPLSRVEARQAWRSAEARIEASMSAGTRELGQPRPDQPRDSRG